MSRAGLNMSANMKSVFSDKKYMHGFGVHVTEDLQAETHDFTISKT